VAREDAWRRRVDQHALALDPPGWLLAELGPVPTDPKERAVWRGAAAELDGYRRAYGLDHLPPAKHGGGRGARADRAGAPATPLAGEGADGACTQPGHRRHDEHSHYQGGRASRRTTADQRHRANLGRLLGAEPRRDAPGRRRDWHGAWAALERLADHHRDRDDRHRPQERPGPLRGRDLGRAERDGR
jgi:hypothetical protein